MKKLIQAIQVVSVTQLYDKHKDTKRYKSLDDKKVGESASKVLSDIQNDANNNQQSNVALSQSVRRIYCKIRVMFKRANNPAPINRPPKLNSFV